MEGKGAGRQAWAQVSTQAWERHRRGMDGESGAGERCERDIGGKTGAERTGARRQVGIQVGREV